MTTWYNSEFRQLELPSDYDLRQKIMTKLNCGLDPNNGIGAIRFYDRQLTIEEISYNHEIDRERFNLT